MRRAALAVMLAGLATGSHVPAAYALAGSEAWCVVDNEGNNHCNYATAQQCLAVAAGSHGFCNENSSGPPALAAPSAGRQKRR